MRGVHFGMRLRSLGSAFVAASLVATPAPISAMTVCSGTSGAGTVDTAGVVVEGVLVGLGALSLAFGRDRPSARSIAIWMAGSAYAIVVGVLVVDLTNDSGCGSLEWLGPLERDVVYHQTAALVLATALVVAWVLDGA